MDVAADQARCLKEEPCRGNNWRNQEVIDLINTIKSNNLMKGCPSGNQLGHLIEPLMGYTRTPFQISGKLKNLRKSYLRCERRGCTPIALKECPYYDLLSEIYASDDVRSCESSDIADAPGDIKVYSRKGIELMLDVIRELNLANNLTLQSFSGKALRLISKMLIAKGVCASVDRVKSTLIGLRKTYIEIRHGKRTKHNSLHFPYYEYLHALWGSMPLPELSLSAEKFKAKTETDTNGERGEYWSEEETAVLLSSVAALDLREEAAKNSEAAAEKLGAALSDSGYARTPSQINEKLDDLKDNFLRAKCAKSRQDAVRQFPIYRLYNSIFGSRFDDVLDDTDETIGDETARETSEGAEEDEAFIFIGKPKYSRSRAWSDDETQLMLSLLEELNLAHHIAHRLSLEVASEVVEPLGEHGFVRSAMQIQVKLRNLRKSYYRCIRAGSTETAIAQCPFYNKLDSIFKKPNGERKLLTRRKLEPVDANYLKVMESCNDHSYYNALSKEQSPKTPQFRGRCEEEYSNSEVWLPVEAICEEGDSTGIAGQEEVTSVLGDENVMSFEEIDDTEMDVMNEESNEPNESEEDFLEESITAVNNDTGQFPCKIDVAKKETKNTNRREREAPGPSRESSKFDPAMRRSRIKIANPYTLRMKRDWPIVKSMKTVMAEVLRHDRLLQRQHRTWMERQFELQRKHDREERELLMKELKELRKSIALSAPKQQAFNDQPSS